MSHTPGPWTAYNTGESVFTIKATSVGVNASANEKERFYYQGIASVTERQPHPQHGGGVSFRESKSNALLIASAPDLLDALQSVHRELRKSGWDMTIVNAALTKAGASV